MATVTTTSTRSVSIEGVDFKEKSTKGKIVIDTYGNEFEVPSYSIKEILNSIPAHCFERSTTLGFGYVLRDLACIVINFLIATTLIPLIPLPPIRVICWAAYIVLQGIFGTGIWVLAHECGHQAFSSSPFINDLVGWVLHSSLLVPYQAWRISHSKHHKATGHLTRDTVFIPKSKETFMSARNMLELTEEAPIITLYQLIVQQLFGWPTYLICNVTGQKYPSVAKWKINHYVPTSPLFSPRDFNQILISDLGILITSSILYFCIQKFGFQNVLIHYFLPYLNVNHWLVFITYLQHCDPTLPHYTSDEWTFAKGAAATIDRNFGFVGTHCFHRIIETHVAHHYCSRIPFYNAEEATVAIKKVMGKHYRYDGTNMFYALWRTARMCQFIEGDSVKMYRNANGLGVSGENKKSCDKSTESRKLK